MRKMKTNAAATARLDRGKQGAHYCAVGMNNAEHNEP